MKQIVSHHFGVSMAQCKHGQSESLTLVAHSLVCSLERAARSSLLSSRQKVSISVRWTRIQVSILQTTSIGCQLMSHDIDAKRRSGPLISCRRRRRRLVEAPQ